MTRPQLHAFGIALGQPEPIAALESAGIDRRSLSHLLSQGLKTYRRSDETPPQLAARAIAHTLAHSALAPEEIDTLVYATTSLHNSDWYTSDISQMLLDLRLGHVDPIGVTLGECGNLVPALRVAAGLLLSGDARNVLFVSTDRSRSPEARLVPPGMTVLSDGAVSCLITREATQGFELLAMHQASNHKARFPESGPDPAQTIAIMAQGVKRAARGAMAKAGLCADEVALVIPGNQTEFVLRLFAKSCGVARDRMFSTNVSSNAHVFTGDGLINLADSASRLRQGDRVLVVVNGTSTWGAAVLRYMGGDGNGQ